MVDNEDEPFPTKQVLKELNSILAQNMKELSKEDREISYMDIHGVPVEIQETPELIEESLEQMETEISFLQEEEKGGYNLALSLDRSYVTNPLFRIKFLRGERFNVSAAARKLVHHFQSKLELFGSTKLVKDIEQDDLHEDDMEMLYNGRFQELSKKDNSGRTVRILFAGENKKQFSVFSKMRVAFYCRMVMAEEEDYQRNGGILLFSAQETEYYQDVFTIAREQQTVAERISHSMPGSIQGIHIFGFPKCSTTAGGMFFKIAQFMMANLVPFLKGRVRIHPGSSRNEYLESLKTFGIPVDVIPESSRDVRKHRADWKRRQTLERKRRESAILSSPHNGKQMNNHFAVIITPRPMDVLLGRGRALMKHQGNLRLRKLVEAKFKYYNVCAQDKRKFISCSIVQEIKESGRFLKQEGRSWVVVSDETARLKVSHAFRGCRDRLRKANKSI